MKAPYYHNGTTGFTNEHGERVCTGSQMGRRNAIPADYTGEKLNLRRVPFVDGAYDPGGAYWGGPATLWCAWGQTDTEQVEVYVRAPDREAAKLAIIRSFPASAGAVRFKS